MSRTIRKKDADELKTFSLAFMGEYINVITDLMIVDYTNTEDQTFEQNAPMIARGYLLDEDESFLYLGDNPFEITQAISKKRLCMVQIHVEKSRYDEILDSMPDPEKEDIN